MGAISELLRWRKELPLLDPSGKELQKVYIRVIGDYDLQESYRLARVVSAHKRQALRDPDSTDYKDEIDSFNEATKEQCVELIKVTHSNDWYAEAISNVVKPEEVRLADIAADPDAPTLEDQEKLDAANAKIEDEYQEKISEYVQQKEVELLKSFEDKDLSELQFQAKVSTASFLPLTVFLSELQDQKVFRAVYLDNEYKLPAFESLEDFRQTLSSLREQMVDAYNSLELGLDIIKN